MIPHLASNPQDQSNNNSMTSSSQTSASSNATLIPQGSSSQDTSTDPTPDTPLKAVPLRLSSPSTLYTLTYAPNYNGSIDRYRPLVEVEPSSTLLAKYRPPVVEETKDASTAAVTTPAAVDTTLSTPIDPTKALEKAVPLSVLEQARVIPSLFVEGFLEFYKGSLYTDAKIYCDSQEFKVHKIVICYKSGYFRKVFQNADTSVHELVGTTDIPIKDFSSVMPSIIEFMYSGLIDINEHNVVQLKLAANFLDFDPLKCEVENFLISFINTDNVFEILKSAITVNDGTIRKICIDTISLNFNFLHESLLTRLFKDYQDFVPLDIILSVIENKHIKKNNTERRVKLISALVERFINEYGALKDMSLFKKIISASMESESLDVNLAIKYLKYCDSKGEELAEESKKCSHALAINFHHIITSDLRRVVMELLPSSFINLLQFDDMYVKDEDSVYEIACEYIDHNKESLSEEQKRKIYACIRFSFLSIPILQKLKEQSTYVPSETLLEALWARISRLEGKKVDESKTSLRPRKNRVFVYEKDFDVGGILYWLGTNFNQESYINPIDRGYVSVTASAPFEVGKAQDLIAHEPSKCNLVGRANSAVIIKFENNRVMPTKYSLRHTMSRDGEALRSWTFSGSIDGINYTDLVVHTNDTTLNLKGSTGSWDVEANGNYYQFFKIAQTGNNSSNNNYLSMAGLELYGLLNGL